MRAAGRCRGRCPARKLPIRPIGSAANFNWLVEDKQIAPHIPVIDKSKREDGTFSREDFTFYKEGNVQGSQFTDDAFTDLLISKGIAISMDGKGAWRDNVFIERFWRTVKYEEVYIRAYDSVPKARSSIGRYLQFYNGRRPHSALDRCTPIKPTMSRCLSAWQHRPAQRWSA